MLPKTAALRRAIPIAWRQVRLLQPAKISGAIAIAALDRESRELMQRHLLTRRAYRERFYRPARALRDELRKRLGIRNVSREPRVPALDEGVLSGAKPITHAANYLVALARRLK